MATWLLRSPKQDTGFGICFACKGGGGGGGGGGTYKEEAYLYYTYNSIMQARGLDFPSSLYTVRKKCQYFKNVRKFDYSKTCND